MNIKLVAMIAVLSLSLQGCAVIMAARQPEKKDTEIAVQGTSRSDLLGEFGTPVETRIEGDKTIDVFKFKQGYSKGAKAGRILLHGVADLWTIFIWELIGTPAEMIFAGKEQSFESTSINGTITQVRWLKH